VRHSLVLAVTAFFFFELRFVSPFLSLNPAVLVVMSSFFSPVVRNPFLPHNAGLEASLPFLPCIKRRISRLFEFTILRCCFLTDPLMPFPFGSPPFRMRQLSFSHYTLSKRFRLEDPVSKMNGTTPVPAQLTNWIHLLFSPAFKVRRTGGLPPSLSLPEVSPPPFNVILQLGHFDYQMTSFLCGRRLPFPRVRADLLDWIVHFHSFRSHFFKVCI